ncbi:MAG: hypothetical protein DCC71_07955 [Proteobacteria bacterium]|nr:MAG: hypothetical protein DCC71_07955 [Pseudomonadota bacterium]
MSVQPPSRARSALLLGAALAACFAGLVAAGLHGFSLASWRSVLDASPAPEVLLGTPRTIRADDWYVQLPLALAQRAHDPPFPRRNENVGSAQDMLLPVAAPVWHPMTLLRPELWGFFLGDDTGLAWMWWTRVLGLLAVWGALSWVVSGGRAAIAALGALFLVCAPLLQLWSLNVAPAGIAAGLGMLGAIGVMRARTPFGVAASAAALAWAIPALVVTFYPPYAVQLAWIGIAVVAGAFAELRPRPHRRSRARSLVLAAAAALGVAIALALLLDAREAIERITATEYPGRRSETGDRLALHRVLATNFGLPLGLGASSAAVASAVSVLTFPVLIAGVAADAVRRRTRPDAMTVALGLVLLGLLAYASLGVPAAVARATGLSWVPAGRVQLGIVVADALLLVRVLSRRDVGPLPATAAGAIAAAWVAALGASGNELHAREPALGFAAVVLLALANGALAFALLRRARPAWLLAGLVALHAAASLWFNPLVRGGSAYLRENALAERILAIDRAAGGESAWVVFGAVPLPNLLRAIGVRAINGVHPIPQLALWRRIDPAGERRSVYDRFAHVLFEVETSDEPRFRRVGPDAFAVRVAPGSPALACLGATHVLVQTREPQPGGVLRAQKGLRWLGSVGAFHLFERAPSACPYDAPLSGSQRPAAAARRR